jgi:hypothetical protein
MRKPRSIHPLLTAMLLWMLSLNTGCQTWDSAGTIPVWSGLNKKSKSMAEPPHKIMAIWTEATHHRPAQPAERGFGGRVIFYDARDQTIKIDGRVTIFVFDDQNALADNPAPRYKFVFPQDSVNAYYSKSELGHSYSFWVPLGSIEAPTQPFSLVVRYDSPSGERVLSELTKKVLVGTGVKASKVSSPEEAGDKDQTKNYAQDREFSNSKIQRVSFDQPISAGVDSTGVESSDLQELDRIRVETIQISPNFARRLNSVRAGGEVQPAWQTNVGSGTGSLQGREGGGDSTNPRGNSSRQSSVSQSSDPGSDQESSLQELAATLHASQSGFSPRQFPAPSKSKFQPTGAAPRREPHPGGWQLGLPPTPRTGFQTDRPTSDSTRPELSDQARLWFEQMNRNRSSGEGGARNSVGGYPAVD